MKIHILHRHLKNGLFMGFYDMRKNKELNERIEALNRRLLNTKYEIYRLAEVAGMLEQDPESEDLKAECSARRSRIETLMRALRKLPENELEMLYLHYEKGLTFRQMEFSGYMHYSFKSLQLKNRIILERMIRQNGNSLF